MDGQQQTHTDEVGTIPMYNMEELIKNHVDSIDKLRLVIKQKSEMLADSFNNNSTYREHQEKVKEANKARLSVKNEISKQPSVASIAQEIKDLKFDLKEKSKTLSDLLLDFKETTGSQQLELFDGRLLEIVTTAKLVRRS